jgi:hypothetical protein
VLSICAKRQFCKHLQQAKQDYKGAHKLAPQPANAQVFLLNFCGIHQGCGEKMQIGKVAVLLCLQDLTKNVLSHVGDTRMVAVLLASKLQM